MFLTPSTQYTRAVSSRYVLLFIALFCLALFAMPKESHAAALTIVAATTTTNNASTTLAKTGNTVTFGLQLSGTPEATTTPTINIFSMGTTSFTGSGAYWQYSTTSASTWTNGFLTFYMAWGGSVGEATTTYTQSGLTGSNVRFDKTLPTISSITSSASCTGSGNACRAGDTIVFTLTPGATEYGATVSGSYNSTALSWSTSDSGATYTATYTVGNGHPAQTSPLQISGVVITDAAGNASSAGSGSDIAKTISVGGGGGSTVTVYSSSGGGSPTAAPATPTVVVATTTPSNIDSLLAQIAELKKKIASLIGQATPTNSPVDATYSRNLMLGSNGSDVRALQLYLIQNMVGSAAQALKAHGATNYFGPLTKGALIEFQKAKGIKPAAGYFGPVTRTFVVGK